MLDEVRLGCRLVPGPRNLGMSFSSNLIMDACEIEGEVSTRHMHRGREVIFTSKQINPHSTLKLMPNHANCIAYYKYVSCNTM